MCKIIFVPVGGLANRMGAMASAVVLAEKTGSRLEVVWFRDWALHAPFGRLFEPIRGDLFRLKDASRRDYLLLDRPRPKNFHLPLLYQKMAFKSCLYERSIDPLCQEHFAFEEWIQTHRRVYMASYMAFRQYDPALMKRLFVPVGEIRQEVDRRCREFATRPIGVHVRRTDNEEAIRQSPIELFYGKLDAEIERDSRTGIYLATDAEEVKQAMKQRYGNRVLTSAKQADRRSLAGIRDGMADMYTLARTGKIYGSFHSTFSIVASQIGNIPLEILRTEERR